jgi:hypothetical protein
VVWLTALVSLLGVAVISRTLWQRRKGGRRRTGGREEEEGEGEEEKDQGVEGRVMMTRAMARSREAAAAGGEEREVRRRGRKGQES